MKSWEEIRGLMISRRSYDQAFIRRMVTIRDQTNADITIPMPTLPGEPEYRQLAPALVADGIENTAMRAAGPDPNIHVPALKEASDRSQDYAHTRRRALYSRWDGSQLKIKIKRAFRQLCGYGTMAWLVMPDPNGDGARVHLRDPMGSYPEIVTPEDIRTPRNCGFVFGRSQEEILRQFPEAAKVIQGAPKQNYRTGDAASADLWDMVEWIDEDSIVVGILGPRSEYLSAPSSITPNDQRYELNNEGMELRRWENKAGMCPVVVPRRVTLDRIMGQMETVIPQIEWMNKIMALEVAAAEKSVFPDIVVIGENGVPKLVGGKWKDGRTGDPNLLENVKGIEQLQGGPNPLAGQVMDRLERNARMTGGVNPMFGGETLGAATRTGRGLDTMAGFSVDPRVQELQEIMAAALGEVNKSIIAVEKGYFPKQQFVVFSGWPSDRGQVKYTPEKHFDSPENTVSYTFPGTDISATTVGIGQLLQMKLMSRHTGRDKHPFVEDADAEERYILEETLDDVIVNSTLQKAVAGEMPLEVVVQIRKAISDGQPISEAFSAAIDEQKNLQAEAEAQMAGGAPQPGQPQLQRGVGPAGSEPAPRVPGPDQNAINLGDMVRTLAGPARAARNGAR